MIQQFLLINDVNCISLHYQIDILIFCQLKPLPTFKKVCALGQLCAGPNWQSVGQNDIKHKVLREYKIFACFILDLMWGKVLAHKMCRGKINKNPASWFYGFSWVLGLLLSIQILWLSKNCIPYFLSPTHRFFNCVGWFPFV